MHVHQAIAHALRDNGADVVFGLIGDGNLFMMDSFVNHAGGRYVSVAHEAAGVIAANGYGRTTGRIGVATVTHGPALTNIVTPLVESVRGRQPLVIVAGDTAVTDKANLQNIDQRSITLPTGAGFEQLRSADSIAEDVATAFRRAVAERRPIVLNVPADFQWVEVDYQSTPPRPYVVQHPRPSEESLDAALGLIASARRPVVVAGLGASSESARVEVLRFARRVGAPVATTLKARHLFSAEPESLGICGTLSTDRTIAVLGESDCVIAFGASLTTWTTAEGGLVSGARVVHVDIDSDALNKFTMVDAPVLGDAGATAAEFVALLDEAQIKPTVFAERVAAIPAQEATSPTSAALLNGTVDIARVLQSVEESFPRDRSLVLDAGRFFWETARGVTCGPEGTYIHTIDFGCIGLGMPNAIGAAIGAPDRPALLITGDGGFMLGGLTEFSSAVRHGLDVVVIVLNDRAYGAEHIQFRNRGMDPSLSMFEWPDLGSVATALGGTGFTVRSEDDLTVALAGIAQRTGPVLVDVHLDPDHIDSPFH